MLEWVFERCAGRGDAVHTPIGYLPTPDAIPTEGLDVAPEAMAELLKVDPGEWRQELQSITTHYDSLGARVPAELFDELARLEKRLG